MIDSLRRRGAVGTNNGSQIELRAYRIAASPSSYSARLAATAVSRDSNFSPCRHDKEATRSPRLETRLIARLVTRESGRGGKHTRAHLDFRGRKIKLSGLYRNSGRLLGDFGIICHRSHLPETLGFICVRVSRISALRNP